MSTELAWAAGLFDGEGSVFVSRTVKRGRAHVRLMAGLQMTTEDVVHRFSAAVGIGAVRGPYFNGKIAWKPKWGWYAGSDGDVRNAMLLLWPWLSAPKKEQASRAFAAREDYIANPPPLPDRHRMLCKRGHELSTTRYSRPGGRGHCRICQVARNLAYRKRRDAPPLSYREAAE